MQIVIDIPESYYKSICEIPKDQMLLDTLLISNGTPLPKGHGDLVDKQYLLTFAHSVEHKYYGAVGVVDVEDIQDAPIIIGADKV